MLEVENKVIVARVAKTFGLGGELTLNLFDTFPADFDTREPLFVTLDELTVPLFCDRFERRGRSGALVVFSDLASERRASELVGCKLWMPLDEEPDDQDEEPDDDRIYLEDLVGYAASLQRASTPGEELKLESIEGVIAEFVDGKNPLFRIDVRGREVLIPAVDEFIAQIDTAAKTIVFDLPTGLLDLYLQTE